jgi:hypothetical protein
LSVWFGWPSRLSFCRSGLMLLNTPRGRGMVIAPHHSKAGRYVEKVVIEDLLQFRENSEPVK